MEVQFRSGHPTHAAALASLGRRSFVETFGHLYKPEDLAAFLANHDEEVWREQLGSPDYSIRFAEARSEPVAYAKIGPPTLPFEAERPSLELRQFYVLQPWHGQGIAQQLMSWVIDETKRRGAQELYLSVFVHNHRARRFYERYGFTFVAPYAFMVGSQADEDHILKLALEDAK